MQIEIIGTDKRLEFCKEALLEADSRGFFSPDLRLIILPIPTTKDKLHVTGSDVLLSALGAPRGGGATFCGYSIPKKTREMLENSGNRVLDLCESEDFLLENARLTAEGTVGYILTRLDRVPSDMKIGVIGYGRIGRFLLRNLLMLGAKIKLYTTRKSVRDEMGKLGIEAEIMDENANFDNLDLLINTSPAKFVGKLDCLKEQPLIIELASGDNFDASVPIEKLPSLPARMYPRSAGRLYAKYILEGLK